MGVYDTVVVDDRDGQVKCWGPYQQVFHRGDQVPDTLEVRTYSIAMREGGYVNIEDARLLSWTEESAFKKVVDVYGDPFDSATVVEYWYDP